MAPSTCQATVPIPDSEGLRRRVTACAQRPARCPPWTPACVGTGAAKASLPRRPGPEPWGTRLLRGCSLPRWPPPAAAPTHTYTRPPPGRSATHGHASANARVLADLSTRGRPAHCDPRPRRPWSWGARLARGGRRCHAEESGGRLPPRHTLFTGSWKTGLMEEDQGRGSEATLGVQQ